MTLATYTYDPLSRRTGLTYGGGASVAYTWSDAGDLLTLAHDFTGSTNDVTFTDTYTAAHQLASETTSNSLFVFPVPASTSLSYARNGLNQYTAVGGTSPTYDGNGSLATDGTYSFAHDVENRLTTATKSGLSALYGYDPLGRRITRSVTTGSFNAWGSFNWSASASCPGAGCWNATAAPTFTVSDGDNEIAEYDGAGSLVARTVPGPAIDDPIATVTGTSTLVRTYFHADRHGSIVAMSGTSSAVTEGPYTYDAYGTVCGASGGSCSTAQTTGTPWRYTGRRLDPETGLYYYRARYYAADQTHGGRFIETDPVGYTPDLDLYTYAGNDPTDKSDPTGLMTCADENCRTAHVDRNPNLTTRPMPSTFEGGMTHLPDPHAPTITFVNDTPNGPSTDRPVTTATAAMVETAVVQAGVSSININSSTGGVHDSPRSLHYQGQAVDINNVNGVPVKAQGASPAVTALQRAFANQSNIRENFGPSEMQRTPIPGRPPVPVTNPKLVKEHQDHLHEGGQN